MCRNQLGTWGKKKPEWNKYTIKILYLNKQQKRAVKYLKGTAELFEHKMWIWLMLLKYIT